MVIWTFLGIAPLWNWNENWSFPVLWPLMGFPNCWCIECSTLTASSFSIWNSSAGIPSPPLAFFVVMLPKVHLTSYYKMSGFRWVITLLWLSGSLRYFLYSSVYSCRLLRSSASASCVANKELASRLDKELSVRKGCGCVLSHFTLTVCDPMDCNPPGDYLQSEGGRQAIWGHRCHCPHRPHVCFCLGHCGSHWAGEEVD